LPRKLCIDGEQLDAVRREARIHMHGVVHAQTCDKFIRKDYGNGSVAPAHGEFDWGRLHPR
jgi:hypothetical protein